MMPPSSLPEIRENVRRFIEERVYPVEAELDKPDRTARKRLMLKLTDEAKVSRAYGRSGIRSEIGGQGMAFMDYVYINEVIGRSAYAMPRSRHPIAARQPHVASSRQSNVAR